MPFLKAKLIKLPSFILPSAAITPDGNILLMTIPRCAMAVSLPPTIVKPRPFPSRPFCTSIVIG